MTLQLNRGYLFVLHVRFKYISLSEHQIQYFHEWRSHKWKYNSWCSRMKYISILYVKQKKIFLFHAFKVFLNICYWFCRRTFSFMTSSHRDVTSSILKYSSFKFSLILLHFNMMYDDIHFLYLKKQNLRMTALFLPDISFWYDVLFIRNQI
jgi:hypothetical protein